MKLKTLAALLTIALAPAAFASTYANAPSGGIEPFGAPDTTSYGETFKLGSAQQLQSWSFDFLGGTPGNYALVVAAWDGSKAVGPALYKADASYGGGTSAASFNAIDLDLAAGQYVAFVTVAGVSGATSGVTVSGSNSDGGLGGEFAFLNSGGTDPLTLNSAWTTDWSPSNMQFSATFGASAVPENSNVALLVSGLGLVGLAARRRKRNS